MAEGGSPGSLEELDPDGTPTAKACILGCGLLRPPDPVGDDPKRSDPEIDPDPKPEAEPDPKPDVEAEGNPRSDADDGCGLLRPDPDGDDPKRSGPEGDPDSPKPEADPDSEAEGDLGPNLNVEGDPDEALEPEVELEPEAEADPEPEADEEPLADAPISDLDSPLLTFK